MRTFYIFQALLFIVLALPMLYVGLTLAVAAKMLWLAPIPTMLCVLIVGIRVYQAEHCHD